jgi:hypothetical protein
VATKIRLLKFPLGCAFKTHREAVAGRVSALLLATAVARAERQRGTLNKKSPLGDFLSCFKSTT